MRTPQSALAALTFVVFVASACRVETTSPRTTASPPTQAAAVGEVTVGRVAGGVRIANGAERRRQAPGQRGRALHGERGGVPDAGAGGERRRGRRRDRGRGAGDDVGDRAVVARRPRRRGRASRRGSARGRGPALTARPRLDGGSDRRRGAATNRGRRYWPAALASVGGLSQSRTCAYTVASSWSWLCLRQAVCVLAAPESDTLVCG